MNQVHTAQSDLPLHDILERTARRTAAPGGRLLTGMECVSSRPVRRIVLREG